MEKGGKGNKKDGWGMLKKAAIESGQIICGGKGRSDGKERAPGSIFMLSQHLTNMDSLFASLNKTD